MNSSFIDSGVFMVGWSLLHLLWQGILIAAVLCILLSLMRRHSANARYVVSCVALALLCLLACVNPLWIPGARHSAPAGSSRLATVSDTGMLEPAASISDDLGPSPELVRVSDTHIENTRDLAAARAIDHRFVLWTSQQFLQSSASLVSSHIQLLVVLWACGVALLALRLFGGWLLLRRLYGSSCLLAGAELEEAFVRQSGRLGIRQRVRIFLAPSGTAPITFGVLKPVVLFPASIVCGLPMVELEVLLAHELAHIRRYDYLVNLLQSLAETLFYYHPAVWWISFQIRAERELCCDELAAGACVQRSRYLARALARMEEMRPSSGQLVLSASGSPLLRRIRRLVPGNRDECGRAGSPVPAMLPLLVIVSLLLCTAYAQMEPLMGTITSTSLGVPEFTSEPLAAARDTAPGTHPDIAQQLNRAANGELMAAQYQELQNTLRQANQPVYQQSPGSLQTSAELLPGMEHSAQAPGAAPNNASAPGMILPATSSSQVPTEVQSRVFDLSYVENGKQVTAPGTAQVVKQVEKLLYPPNATSTKIPDRRFWYDSESGQLTIVDFPQQLNRATDYLAQPRVQAALGQDSSNSSATQRLLERGQTMKFGDVALRLESVGFAPSHAEQLPFAEVLVRKGRKAEVRKIAEMSSIYMDDCAISVMEISGAADSPTSMTCARIELRIMKPSEHLPPLPSDSEYERITSYPVPLPSISVPKTDLTVLAAEFEMLYRAAKYDEAMQKLQEIKDQKPSDSYLQMLVRRAKQPLVPSTSAAQSHRAGPFRVRLSTFPLKEQADILAEELKKEGYKPIEIKLRDGQFDVLCGDASSESAAENLKQDLKRAGFTAAGIVTPAYDPDAMPAMPGIVR